MQTKTMTRSILLAWAVFAACAIYGDEPARGVAGVDVVVKQSPRNNHVVTDARGNFAVEALAAGSYTLTFRSLKAEHVPSTSDKVIVATLYSIKIDGTKRAVKKSGLTSDDLLAGVDVEVNLGPGARIRGQVAAGASKNMVWIPKEPGTNIPGRWVEEGSVEAKAAVHHNAQQMSAWELQKR